MSMLPFLTIRPVLRDGWKYFHSNLKIENPKHNLVCYDKSKMVMTSLKAITWISLACDSVLSVWPNGGLPRDCCHPPLKLPDAHLLWLCHVGPPWLAWADVCDWCHRFHMIAVTVSPFSCGSRTVSPFSYYCCHTLTIGWRPLLLAQHRSKMCTARVVISEQYPHSSTLNSQSSTLMAVLF